MLYFYIYIYKYKLSLSPFSLGGELRNFGLSLSPVTKFQKKQKAEEHFFCSESTSIPTQVASSTSGANDKTALLKGFFVNFELLFEWESCLKL